MSNNIKYDHKLILLSTILIILAAFGFFYWEPTKILIRWILEAKFTSFLLWVVTVLIFVVHFLKHKKKEIEMEPIISKKFGAFIDSLLGGIGYGTAISTSITLLKGLFIQQFFKDIKFFHEFESIDIMTIFGVTIFILYFSSMKVIETAKETYRIEHTEQVMNEQNEVIIPIEIDEENQIT